MLADKLVIHLLDQLDDLRSVPLEKSPVGSQMASDDLRRGHLVGCIEESLGWQLEPVDDESKVLEIRNVAAFDTGQRVDRHADLVPEVTEAHVLLAPTSPKNSAEIGDFGVRHRGVSARWAP